MEKRVEQLETDVSAMRVNIATILSTCATKDDMNALYLATKADIGELRSPAIQASPAAPLIITLPSPAAPGSMGGTDSDEIFLFPKGKVTLLKCASRQ